MKPKLTKNLETLILFAVKQVGAYDPELVDAYIGEQLIGAESKTCYDFLTWVKEGIDLDPEAFPGRKFGYGNIRERFKEYVSSLKSPRQSVKIMKKIKGKS